MGETAALAERITTAGLTMLGRGRPRPNTFPAVVWLHDRYRKDFDRYVEDPARAAYLAWMVEGEVCPD